MPQVSTERLLKDLHVVIHDAEQLLMATAGQTGEQITQIRDRAEASLRSAKAQLAALGIDAEGMVRGAAARGDAYVRGNPWIAVGAGAAAGLVIGLLLGRRSGRPD